MTCPRLPGNPAPGEGAAQWDTRPLGGPGLPGGGVDSPELRVSLRSSDRSAASYSSLESSMVAARGAGAEERV